MVKGAFVLISYAGGGGPCILAIKNLENGGLFICLKLPNLFYLFFYNKLKILIYRFFSLLI